MPRTALSTWRDDSFQSQPPQEAATEISLCRENGAKPAGWLASGAACPATGMAPADDGGGEGGDLEAVWEREELVVCSQSTYLGADGVLGYKILAWDSKAQECQGTRNHSFRLTDE